MKYKEGTSVQGVLDSLTEKEFVSTTIQSNYPLGDQTMTDFLVKQPGDEVDNLARDLVQQRNDFLQILNTAPSEVEAQVQGEKFTLEEIKAAQNNLAYTHPKAVEVRVVAREAEKVFIEESFRAKQEVAEVVLSEVVAASPEQTQTPSLQLPETPEVREERSLKDRFNFRKLFEDYFAGIKTQAQTYPDWVPDYTSVSFFDTDEVGAWVYTDWEYPGGQTPSALSVTHGNGSMFVAHRGGNNRIYVGKWDSNGNNFLGWGELPGAVTYDSPAIEYYWGRVYVVHRGTNNRMYVNYSPNEGGSWTSYQELPGDTVKAPDLETVGNTLYLVHRGGDGYPYLSQISNGNSSWSGWSRRSGRLTDEKVTLADVGGSLYLGLKERGSQDALVNINAINYSTANWRTVRGYTKGSFSFADTGQRVCFLIRDINDELVQGCTDFYNLNNNINFTRAFLNSSVDPVMDKDWRLMQISADLNQEIAFRPIGFGGGTRGYISEMRWNNGGIGFQENNAYEHKIALANGSTTQNSTYLSKNTSPAFLCIPQVVYVTSSLPNPYLDTRARFDNFNNFSFCDNTTSEVSYTLGSTYPRRIQPNEVYMNYWVDNKGSLNYPRFSLRYQRGENRPDDCFNANSSSCDSLTQPDVNYIDTAGCNSSDGDAFCVWQDRCEVICGGDFLTPKSFPGSGNYFINPPRTSNTYPYYYWVFTK